VTFSRHWPSLITSPAIAWSVALSEASGQRVAGI
jgi:hypothetical protein